MMAPHPKLAEQQADITLIAPANVQTNKRRRKQQTALIVSCRILLLIVLVAVWQLISGRFVNPLFISSPWDIVIQLKDWLLDGTLLSNTLITMEEAMLGLIFGIVSGILAGFLLGAWQTLARILDPFIVALYSIPKVALAPLFIVWFGVDMPMKVILASVIVFFLVFFNTLAGVRNVDQDLIDAVLLMGGERRDIILKVIVPSATGYVLTGLRIAIPYALIGAVIAELIASNHGLGYLIYNAQTQFDTAGVFAALLVLTIVASLLNAVVDFIDRKTSRWKTVMNIDRKVIP
ncbi:MAG TPA: ABC transporter permease [Ktedonobacteraceae bacterium]